MEKTKITLTSISITNFMGINSLVVDDFNKKINLIEGDNEEGKTSIADAYSWCFLGVNSHGQSLFDILPLDNHHKVIPNKYTQVEITISINNDIFTIERKLVPKYSKDDNDIEVISGYETFIKVNSIQKTPTAYKQFIEKYCSIEYLKLLTINTAFNNLNQNKTRDILLKLVPGVDKLNLNELPEKYKSLVPLLKVSSLEEIYDSKIAEKTNLTTALVKLKGGIEALKAQLTPVDNLVELNQNKKIITDEITKLQDKLNKVQNLNFRISSASNTVKDREESIKMYTDLLTDLRLQKDKLKEEFDKLTDGVEPPKTCPTCNRALTKAYFSSVNSKMIRDNKKQQKKVIAEATKLDLRISKGKSKISDLEHKFKEAVELKSNLKKELREINVKEIKLELIGLKDVLKDYDAKISSTENSIKISKAIEDNQQKGKATSQQIADVKNILSLITSVQQIHIDKISNQINSLFERTQFVLFETLRNGNVKPICKASWNGVFYDKTLNTGTKINLELDIIKTISRKLNILVPLFIDNYESVTQKITLENQIFKLKKVDDKPLTINNKLISKTK